MSLASAARCVSRRTKAVLFVHLYGQAGNVDAWLDLCASHDIHFIEDCAQAQGAKSNGIPVGSLGKFGSWSFYPTKNLGCLGDGGALTTNDTDLADQVAMLRNYGQSKRYYHDVLGINSRLDEVQAAILNVRLTVLDEWNERRRQIAMLYDRLLVCDAIEKMAAPVSADSHVHHLYVIRCAKRAALMEFLAERGVETLIHYPIPVSRQKAARERVVIGPDGLPQAEYHASTCLSLPCHAYLTDEQVEHVADSVNAFS
jgi:dTDP-4-amino-4,6-dideoxygalactose transaminase